MNPGKASATEGQAPGACLRRLPNPTGPRIVSPFAGSYETGSITTTGNRTVNVEPWP